MEKAIGADCVRTSAQIIVNFFIGGEQDSLFCRIDDGEWRKMNHTPVHDPFFVREVVDWDFTEELFPGRLPSNPAESSQRHFRMSVVSPKFPPTCNGECA
jgi:hypothetical protein